jgi:hypothetical protein
LASLNATETPVATATLPPTATLTQAPPTDLPTTAPTLPPSPTAMRLPAIEIMSMVSGPPVMDEPFADNTRTWAVLSEGSEFTLQEGSLMLRSNQTGQPAGVFCSGTCGPYKDFYYYEAEVVDERASGFGYGLIFALNGQKNAYYAFKVRPANNEYGLFKFQNGALTPLIDWTASPAVLPAPQVNVLGVAFVEKKIDLYLNGSRINSYTDQTPYNEGQIGFVVDQDGVRLMANRAVVYELIPRTPEAPGAGTTPIAGATTAPGATQGAAVPPAVNTPVAFTATPTRAGNCPAYVPDGQWLLVVMASTTAQTNARFLSVEINGVSYTLKELNTAFYLNLNQNYTVRSGNRSQEFFQSTCKVVYFRAAG